MLSSKSLKVIFIGGLLSVFVYLKTELDLSVLFRKDYPVYTGYTQDECKSLEINPGHELMVRW